LKYIHAVLKLLFLQLTNKKGIYILIVFEIYHGSNA
jgi:hypothetical protein